MKLASTKFRHMFACIAIVSALSVVLCVCCCSTGSTGRESTTPVVEIGEETRFKSTMWVCLTQEDMDALSEAVSANDKIGVLDLELSGRIFTVSEGTKVLVIDRSLFRVKVRILEGKHFGKAGWTIHEVVD